MGIKGIKEGSSITFKNCKKATITSKDCHYVGLNYHANNLWWDIKAKSPEVPYEYEFHGYTKDLIDSITEMCGQDSSYWEKEYSRMTFFEKSDEQKFVELLQRIHCLEQDIDALARLFYSTHCLDK